MLEDYRGLVDARMASEASSVSSIDDFGPDSHGDIESIWRSHPRTRFLIPATRISDSVSQVREPTTQDTGRRVCFSCDLSG